MRTFLFCLAVLLVLPSVVSGTVIQAGSCERVDVQTAIDLAQNGDTVRVPAGNCVWGDGERIILSGNYAYPSIFINKSLILIGLSPNISGSGTGYLIVYTPSDFSQNWPLRISGFVFDGGGTRSGIFLSYSSTDLTVQDNIRIDNNIFLNMAGQAIWINGQRGVADNNIFNGTAYPIRFASGDDRDWWDNWEGLVFGKADNNFYFEDNVIEADEIAVDCQYGNRYAFRYNTISASAPGSYPLMDMHGDAGTSASGCAYRSCFGSEMYGNHITINSGYSDFRGGKHVVFYNFVSTTGNFWGLRDWESVTAGIEACECVYCPSTNPQPQHISDSYAWNNRGGSLSGVISPFFSRGFKDCTSQCGYIVNENDEFFNHDSSFDGTSGMGCGLLENIPSACTTGVGYWATYQSCSDLTGMVGASPITPLNGSLYKCTSTDTWIPYYTPLDYPHPLTIPVCGDGIQEGSEECDDGNTQDGDGCDSGCMLESAGSCQPTDQYVAINSTHIQTCSCEQVDVGAAIDAATYGMTVLVPAGSCTWNSTLTITKGITLRGAGFEDTIIKTDGPGTYEFSLLFSADQTTSANDHPFRLSGFTFQQVSAHYGGLYISNQDITNELSNVIIHDNRFIGRNGSGIGIGHGIGTFGVIHNNIIQDVSHAWRFLGSITGWTQVEEWVPGSSNAMYYEDNYIYSSDDFGSSLIVSGGAGNRYVGRYNIINLSVEEPFGGSMQSYDIHGNQYNNPSGGIGLELYGNLRIGTRGRWIDQRGGQVFFFYNQWMSSDNLYPGSINIWEEYDDDDFQTVLWPSNSRYGRTDEGNIMQRPIKSYYWRNYGGIDGDMLSSTLNILFDHYDRSNNILNDPLILFENNNWFRDNAIAFDGMIDPVGSCGYYGGVSCTKSGVGCGTLTEMNAITNCSEGAGFFATDKSCTDLTGMVGSSPVSPISGTLYKCSATDTWEEYYTPYIYPHPLTLAPPGTEICGEGEITSECWCEGMRTSGYCCHGYHAIQECATAAACIHRAERAPCDSMVDMTELVTFIGLWHMDSTANTMTELMDAITLWKDGQT